MRVRVLGPLVVEVDDHSVPITAAKQRAVLELLALRAGAVVAPAEIIRALWDDDSPRTATKAIQTYISALRYVLPVGVIETIGGGYRLNVDRGDVDAIRFEALVERALEDGKMDAASRRAALEEALTLWRGEALADLQDVQFGITQVARLQELRRVAEEELFDLRLEAGESAALIAQLELSVASEALRERRWGQLMLALYRSGRQAEALRAYQRLRELLSEQLGLEPSGHLRSLEARILGQDPDLLPPLVALRRRLGEPFSVPQPESTLIGRHQEMSELSELLVDHRLVTLTGPGGCGKTRLAVAVATAASGQFPDGVYWIPLSAVTDPDLVLPTIGRALHAGGELASALSGRRVLVVLDNLEQVLAATDQLAEIMAFLPDTRWLVTSRERLHLTLEQEYPVSPLAQHFAVELFVQRARQLQPGFRADEHVWQICHRLDGLPLAVELASAQVKVLTTSQMLERIDRRFELLRGAWRDRPDRHATMRAAIDWSYNLLSEGEAALLRSLATFAGDFAAEAAEAVCRLTLSDLQSLLDKSLVHRTADGRFYLLETTRQYLLERIDAGDGADAADGAEARARHAAWYCDQAEAWSRQVFFWSGPRPTAAQLARMDMQRKGLHMDADNFRAAMSWAMETDVMLAIRLMNALTHLWEAQGLLAELAGWFEGAFARQVDLPDAVRAEALRAYAAALTLSGRNDLARALIEESLTMYRRIGDAVGQAWCLVGLGNLCAMDGLAASALPFHQEALDILAEVGEHPVGALAALCLGNDLAETKNFEAAEALLLDAAAEYEAFGNATGAAVALQSLADALLDEGDGDGAELQYRDALRLAAANGVTALLPYILGGMAGVAGLRGEAVESGRLWRLKEVAEKRTPVRIEPLARARWDRLVGPLRERPEFAAGYESARSTSLEDAVEKMIVGAPAPTDGQVGESDEIRRRGPDRLRVPRV